MTMTSIFQIVSWRSLGKTMVQIDTGMTPATWATDANNMVYELQGNNFVSVPGTIKFSHVTSGSAGVWGASTASDIFYRDMATKSWKKIAGRLKQIDSGPKGVVCGVNNINKVFCRTGISDYNPEGFDWVELDRPELQINYISCGEYGHWAATKDSKIFFREGIIIHYIVFLKHVHHYKLQTDHKRIISKVKKY